MSLLRSGEVMSYMSINPTSIQTLYKYIHNSETWSTPKFDPNHSDAHSWMNHITTLNLLHVKSIAMKYNKRDIKSTVSPSHWATPVIWHASSWALQCHWCSFTWYGSIQLWTILHGSSMWYTLLGPLFTWGGLKRSDCGWSNQIRICTDFFT